MTDRAITEAQKREVIEQLLKLWEQAPELRLGQMISNAVAGDPFYIEDYDLIRRIEANNKKNRGKL
jgi:hypothetical protein